MESSQTAAWSVVCLCAAWCGVCREYQPGFEALARKRADVHWQWVDVETHDDILEALDIETFPTLLIARGDEVVFFGPLLPQHTVLERLVQSLQSSQAPSLPAHMPVHPVWVALRAALA